MCSENNYFVYNKILGRNAPYCYSGMGMDAHSSNKKFTLSPNPLSINTPWCTNSFDHKDRLTYKNCVISKYFYSVHKDFSIYEDLLSHIKRLIYLYTFLLLKMHKSIKILQINSLR